MAKGITQDQFNEVADRLLLAGERPTIERIRQALGTGSPNTVNRFLDLWWADLGRRLTQAHHKLALPEAPTEVIALASQLWEQALASAGEQARQGLETDRGALADERATLATQHASIQADIALLRDERDAAHQEKVTALVRLADLERLLDQQSRHLEDLTAQRQRAVMELAYAQADVLALQTEQQRREQTWRDERAALEATHTAMQDRWLGEVDRARQDETRLAAKLKLVEQSAEAAARKAGEQLAELAKRLQLTEREDAKKAARITSLEEEIKRVHEQLKARLQMQPVERKVPSKKTKTAS